MDTEEKIRLAKKATWHVLNAICDDPRKYWLMGELTESWAQLTAAHAALWDCDLKEVRQNFQPDKERYQRYCDEQEENERLLRYCRAKGIKPEEGY